MHRLLALVAGLALAGCETSPQTTAPSQQHQTPSDPHEERAPLLLSLHPVADEAGVLELVAHLDAPSALPLPVELTVALPPGAKLLDGEARQSVPVAAGRTTRTFRIAHDIGELTSPIKVTAHVEHPKRAWGIHTEKSFPEAPKVAPATLAKPPVARPPAPARRNEAH